LIHLATILILSGMFSGQVVVPAPPQTPPRDRMPPRVGTGVVKGRVVDGTTGAAIARARVMLQGGGGNSSPALTDGEGAFTFTALPPGPVMLAVMKATYLSTRYPTAGRTIRSQSRPVILRDAQVLDNVVIPMFHGGSISGRVFDANGDVVENVQVVLLRVPAGGRVGKPTQRGGSQTDDLGEFRIGRLEPGTYLVQAMARRDSEMGFGPSAAQMPQAPPLPAPLPTFYPAALAMEQAQPIVVDRAQAVTGIDIVLGEGIPGVVTGTVVTATGEPLPANMYPNVSIRRAISEGMPDAYGYSSGAMTRPDGTFRAVLAPGEYTIEARVMPRMAGVQRPEDEQVATARVSVASGGEESLTMTVGPGASATGRVIFEGNSPPPASPGRVRVPMFSENGMCRSGEAEVAPDWSFRIRGISGTCSAQPSGGFGRWMLKAVNVNGQNLLDAPVTFQPGQQLRDVQVVVTDRPSSMTFQVSDETGQPTRDFVAVVYPVDKGRWTNSARTYVPPTMAMEAMRSAMNSPGPANPAMIRPQMLPGLRPGDYYVIAVDDLEFEDIRDPVVLDRLRSSATRVSVSEGSTVNVSLQRAGFADLMRQR